jgi:hypothetical protein
MSILVGEVSGENTQPKTSNRSSNILDAAIAVQTECTTKDRLSSDPDGWTVRSYESVGQFA